MNSASSPVEMSAPLASVLAGPATVHNVSPSTSISIGRDRANTIVLDHVQVSRRHARVGCNGGRYYLQDLNSTNGTFLNGAPVRSEPLKVGDRIQISDFTLLFDGRTLTQYSEEGNARIDAIKLRRVVGSGQVILHDISICIHPREFIAVVGVSGAGKSTLVSAISGFRPADHGRVLFNGVDYYRNLASFRSTLGYVPQDDIIHPELTVHRALSYAAQLRMPKGVSGAERQQRIEEVLRDLQLVERRDVPIHRLSGGQRKRVSIGVELLTKPRLFFLDEPTSGLDPGIEAQMMQIFRHLAGQGHTLVLITHATENIMLTDHVAFLARGGYLAYYGPPRDALAYFEAEKFTDIYQQVESQRTPEEWGQRYVQSSHYRRWVLDRLGEVETVVRRAQQEPTRALSAVGTGARASSAAQFLVLMRRYLDILGRDRVNLGILLAQAPLLSLILLVLMYDQQNLLKPYVAPKDVKAIADAAKHAVELAATAKILLFLLTFFSVMCGTINSVREIVKELPIYRRERAVNQRIVPYVISKFAVLALVSAFQTAVFVGIVFSVVRPPPGVEAFWGPAFLTLFAVNLAGVALGLAVSAAVSTQNTAVTSLPVVLLSQVVLSGILLKLKGLPLLTSLTIMKWGFGLLGAITRMWAVAPGEIADEATERGKYYAMCNLPHASEALIVFIVVFLVTACAFQWAKDRVRD